MPKTGSQASGDAYVAATLEALIADANVIEEPKGPRVALYRLFTKIWNSISVNGAKEGAASALPGEQKLASITPLPRQAFLLVALEGFAEPEAARTAPDHPPPPLSADLFLCRASSTSMS